MKGNELILFETEDQRIKLDVPVNGETVWLSLNQMVALFGRDKSTISRHIRNALREELEENSVVAFFATTASDGKQYQVEYYNLDVIISVGYRVKSKRGVEFRRWANTILRQYIIQGYAANDNRLKQMNEVIQIMKRAEYDLDAKQVLDVIESYSTALDMLDDYDHQTLDKPKGRAATYELTYDECRSLINKMQYSNTSSVFGIEKDDSFKGSIGAIYQSFEGVDLYPSLEEKAANLLYYITKNHSFSDGNKRIAATMFIYFLDKNNSLLVDSRKIIGDYTLVALTIMIAESKPEEKELMIKVIMNCFGR